MTLAQILTKISPLPLELRTAPPYEMISLIPLGIPIYTSDFYHLGFSSSIPHVCNPYRHCVQYYAYDLSLHSNTRSAFSISDHRSIHV